MIGKGTPADPKRPQYTPWPPSQKAKGIISFTSQVSDDGKFALVEFAALDDSAFAQILNDKTVKAFEKGKASKADIVLELKKYKRDFDLDKFGAVAR